MLLTQMGNTSDFMPCGEERLGLPILLLLKNAFCASRRKNTSGLKLSDSGAFLILAPRRLRGTKWSSLGAVMPQRLSAASVWVVYN